MNYDIIQHYHRLHTHKQYNTLLPSNRRTIN